MARLTLNGMYEYEPSIFDGMILPEDYDKPTLLFEIMQRSGQLYPYHQQPLILKEGIRLWFARNYLNFDRTMAALTAEYNPIENYDRNEKWRRTPDLTDEERNTGSDTLATSGTDTTSSSGTDTDTLSGQDTDTLSGIDTDTLSGSDNVERTHTNYDEATTRTYTGYNEKNVKTGTDTTERTVSAFDGSGYQPAEKTVETFGSVQDSKDITGSYKDDKKITGSYKDTTTYGKVDTTAYGKVDTMAYGKVDTMTYGKSDTTTYGKTDTQTFGKISTDRHTGKEDFESRIHGNIGVTTSQQMIESELELRKFDIYADIARRFENEFIVQVY